MPRALDPSYGSYKPQAAESIAQLIQALVSGQLSNQDIVTNPGYGPVYLDSPQESYSSDLLAQLRDPNNFAPETNAPNDLELLAKQRAATGGADAPQSQDPLAKLLQMGQQLMGGSGGSGFDYESAKGDILGQINRAYSPMIAAIRGQSRHAKKETSANQDELQKLYGSLARYDNRQAGREENRTGRESLALKRLGNRTGNQLQNTTDRSVNREKNLLQGLGVQAAGAGTISPMIKEGQYQENQATRSAAGAQRMAQGVGANQSDLLESLGSSAKLEGTNAQADALTQLQDYLGQNRLAIAGVLGQQAQARASALQSLATSSMSAQASQANQGFENWNTLFDNILQARGQSASEAYNQQKLAAAAQGSQNSLLPSNYSNAFSLLGGNTELESLVKSMMAEPAFVSGQQAGGSIYSGEHQPITPEYAQQEIARLAQEHGGLTQEQIQMLMQAVYTLYK